MSPNTLYLLGENARKRHYHETYNGNGIAFSVQLEVFVNKLWQAVIRYDSAHGFAHIDQYSLDGKKIKKELHLNLNEALTLADEDIKRKLESVSKGFFGG